MPYEKVEDAIEKHPSLMKYPAKRRRQWMHIMNSCLAKDSGDEGRCFAMAWGVIKPYRKKEGSRAESIAAALVSLTDNTNRRESMNKQISLSPAVFRLLQVTLPLVSRGIALYAGELLDHKTVESIRVAGLRTRKADLETRQAFADAVADLVSKHKSPKEFDELKLMLTADRQKDSDIQVDEILSKVKALGKKAGGDVAESYRDEMKKSYTISQDTGEKIKNYINWERMANGHYKGALIKSIGSIAFNMAEKSPMDKDEIEANLSSTYVLETMNNLSQLMNSPFTGSYLRWIGTHLSRRSGLFPEQIKKHSPGTTTLDAPIPGDEGEGGSAKDQISEDSMKERGGDLNVNDPEVREMINGLKTWIKTHQSKHWPAIHILLDEVIKNRSWSMPSQLWTEIETKIRELPVDYKPHAVTKTLLPHLRLEATNYFKDQKIPGLNKYMKQAINKMNDSWVKSEALESLKSRADKINEEDEKQKTSSTLSSRLLQRVAGNKDIELVGLLISSVTDNEPGHVMVFEKDRPEFSHCFACVKDGDQLRFEMPHDMDALHVEEACRIAHVAYKEQEDWC